MLAKSNLKQCALFSMLLLALAIVLGSVGAWTAGSLAFAALLGSGFLTLRAWDRLKIAKEGRRK